MMFEVKAAMVRCVLAATFAAALTALLRVLFAELRQTGAGALVAAGDAAAAQALYGLGNAGAMRLLSMAAGSGALLAVSLSGAAVLFAQRRIAAGLAMLLAWPAHRFSPAAAEAAMGVMLIFALFAVYAGRRMPNRAVRRLAGLIAAALILGISFATVSLGKQSPAGVLGGFAAAAIWVGAFAWAERREMVQPRKARRRVPGQA